MEFQSHPILRQEMVLSTQNIKAAWVSTSPGQKVIPLPLLEILKKAHANGSVDYYYFSELQIHGDCVSVTLSNSSKIFKEGLAEDCTLCGGGTTYTFRKEAGSWKGGYFIGWVH